MKAISWTLIILFEVKNSIWYVEFQVRILCWFHAQSICSIKIVLNAFKNFWMRSIFFESTQISLNTFKSLNTFIYFLNSFNSVLTTFNSLLIKFFATYVQNFFHHIQFIIEQIQCKMCSKKFWSWSIYFWTHSKKFNTNFATISILRANQDRCVLRSSI